MFRRVRQFFSKRKKPAQPLTKVEVIKNIEFLEARVKELGEQAGREIPMAPDIRMPGTAGPISATQLRRAQAIRELERFRALKRKMDSQS